jgi:hypothetical protein
MLREAGIINLLPLDFAALMLREAGVNYLSVSWH